MDTSTEVLSTVRTERANLPVLQNYFSIPSGETLHATAQTPPKKLHPLQPTAAREKPAYFSLHFLEH